MVKAAAFAEFGAIRAIAETARHADIRWFIPLPSFEFPAGLPGADVSRLPAWLTVQHDACHRSIIVKYQIITPSGGDGGV
jgi:hypothetical protein